MEFYTFIQEEKEKYVSALQEERSEKEALRSEYFRKIEELNQQVFTFNFLYVVKMLKWMFLLLLSEQLYFNYRQIVEKQEYYEAAQKMLLKERLKAKPPQRSAQCAECSLM